MDCVVLPVMCLSMPNTAMENDGKYETIFFFNTVIYNMKVLHFKHSYTLKGQGIVLSQIHVIQYSREVKGIGMGSDRNSLAFTKTHRTYTRLCYQDLQTQCL